MGQCYKVVNFSKKEYIVPNAFGDGLKLKEFACSGNATMTALAVLTVDPKTNGNGGGDFMPSGSFGIIGRWYGDSIGIVGNYEENGLYYEAEKSWKDISREVVATMIQAYCFLF